MTKIFTAAAVLRLVEEGKLDLDSSIRVEFQRGADGKVVEVVTAFDERSVRAQKVE